jgi:putative transposase
VHRKIRPVVNDIDQCWSMDFVADNLFNGRRSRTLTILDNFSRECLAIRIGQILKGDDVVVVMDDLKHRLHQLPLRIQTDNGSEFISKMRL